MRLISLVIIKHSFLGNLILNFGGSWILKFNNGRIDREKNDLFIDGFYDSHNYLTLVSAIVGKNGSGKSTIFEILRYSINNKSGYNAILVFEDIHRNVYTSVTKSHNLMDIVLNENPNSDEIQNQENLPEFLFDIQDYSEQLRSIFYSPFLDLKADIFNFSESVDIDISLCRSITNDFDTNESLENANVLYEHKLIRTWRQIEFLQSKISKDLFKDISIKQFESAKVIYRKFESFRPENTLGNLSSDFKRFHEIIIEKWRSEISKTNRRISQDKNEESIKIMKLWFLHDLINSIFKAVDSTNQFLQEAFFSMEKEELENMTLHESFKLFLDKHYFSFERERKNLKPEKVFHLPATEINALINIVFETLDRNDDFKFINSSDYHGFQTDFDQLKKIMKAISDFKKGMKVFDTRFANFIDIEPSLELSSGERHILELFSNFYQIKVNNLIKRNPEIPIDPEDAPLNSKLHIIILIDEGEVGFHPEWKKKYVNLIIKFLPKILKSKQIDSIQVIFSTHDAITLSDLPVYNICYLTKELDGVHKVLSDLEKPKVSFGANISDLISQSFFINNGLVGEFASKKINDTIDWLKRSDDFKDQEKSYHKNLIQLIGEPFLQRKLAEMYSIKTGESLLENDILERQIRLLMEKQEKLKNDKHNNK